MRKIVCYLSFFLLAASCGNTTIIDDNLLNTRNSVAQVLQSETENGEYLGVGSAFLIGPKELLTSWHVVNEKGFYLVEFPNGDRIKVGHFERLGNDDVAELFLDKPAKQIPLKISSKNPAVLEDVYAIGYPMDFGLLFTKGVVSGYKDKYPVGDQIYHGMLFVTAGIGPGNSGGPVVNSKGEVVGLAVLYAKIVNDAQMAIACERLKFLLEVKKAKKARQETTFDVWPSFLAWTPA